LLPGPPRGLRKNGAPGEQLKALEWLFSENSREVFLELREGRQGIGLRSFLICTEPGAPSEGGVA